MSDVEDESDNISLPNSEERDNLRKELEDFVRETKTRVGSDGKNLVEFPADFDSVSDSLHRSDLAYDISDRPWMKYLTSKDAAGLGSGVFINGDNDDDDDNEAATCNTGSTSRAVSAARQSRPLTGHGQGQSQTVSNADERGLAMISELDRQLKALEHSARSLDFANTVQAQETRQVQEEILNLPVANEDDDDNEEEENVDEQHSGANRKGYSNDRRANRDFTDNSSPAGDDDDDEDEANIKPKSAAYTSAGSSPVSRSAPGTPSSSTPVSSRANSGIGQQRRRTGAGKTANKSEGRLGGGIASSPMITTPSSISQPYTEANSPLSPAVSPTASEFSQYRDDAHMFLTRLRGEDAVSAYGAFNSPTMNSQVEEEGDFVLEGTELVGDGDFEGALPGAEPEYTIEALEDTAAATAAAVGDDDNDDETIGSKIVGSGATKPRSALVAPVNAQHQAALKQANSVSPSKSVMNTARSSMSVASNHTHANSKGTTGTVSSTGKNFLKANKLALRTATRSTTDDEERRLAVLLQDLNLDDEVEMGKDVDKDGGNKKMGTGFLDYYSAFSEDERDLLAEIEEDLRRHQQQKQTDQGGGEEDESGDTPASDGADQGKDQGNGRSKVKASRSRVQTDGPLRVLEQQRKARQEKQHVQELNQALEFIQGQNDNNLFHYHAGGDNSSSSGCSIGGGSSIGSRIVEQDIASLIRSSSQQNQQQSGLQSSNRLQGNHQSDTVPPKVKSKNFGQIMNRVITRSDVDAEIAEVLAAFRRSQSQVDNSRKQKKENESDNISAVDNPTASNTGIDADTTAEYDMENMTAEAIQAQIERYARASSASESLQARTEETLAAAGAMLDEYDAKTEAEAEAKVERDEVRRRRREKKSRRGGSEEEFELASKEELNKLYALLNPQVSRLYELRRLESAGGLGVELPTPAGDDARRQNVGASGNSSSSGGRSRGRDGGGSMLTPPRSDQRKSNRIGTDTGMMQGGVFTATVDNDDDTDSHTGATAANTGRHTNITPSPPVNKHPTPGSQSKRKKSKRTLATASPAGTFDVEEKEGDTSSSVCPEFSIEGDTETEAASSVAVNATATASELVNRVNNELRHAQLRAEVEAEFEQELQLQREQEQQRQRAGGGASGGSSSGGGSEWEMDEAQTARTKELERQLQLQEEQLRRLRERKQSKSRSAGGTTPVAHTLTEGSARAATHPDTAAASVSTEITAADEQYFLDEDFNACPLRQQRRAKETRDSNSNGVNDSNSAGTGGAYGKRAGKAKTARPKSQPTSTADRDGNTPVLPRIRTPGTNTGTGAPVGVPSGIKISYAGHTDKDTCSGSGNGSGKRNSNGSSGSGARANSLPNIHATGAAAVETGTTGSGKVCI